MTQMLTGNLHIQGEHLLRCGNTNCAGCGMSLGLQLLDQGLGGEKPIMVIPACCGIVTAGAFPGSAYGAPVAATTFASSPAVATGLSTVQRLCDEDAPVICWAGDGGTYDIGIATLSAAAERNEDIIYICYDNEIYGNTGGQRSSATPMGIATTTSPFGKGERKKDIMSIMAAHRIPYAATLSVAHRDDFLRKVRFARRVQGFRFMVMLSPCPTGWKSEAEESVDLVRYAVGCGLFPLYEIFDGLRYRINVRPDGVPLEEYALRQRRYTRSSMDLADMNREIDRQWAHLDAMARMFPADNKDGLTENNEGDRLISDQSKLSFDKP